MDQHTNPMEQGGGYGSPTPEEEMGGAAGQADAAQPGAADQPDAADQPAAAGQADAAQPGAADQPDADQPGADTAVPSADAEMDDANTESTEPDRGYSSEPSDDAAGLPDGSATGLTDEKSPTDDEDKGERFDAG
ncbi:hypothetical protein [Arthrobacter sp. M4]|uniref:hypothetical protein n=1 Tax=Arthrobacter sp. M4 TaxID=218160 RepID=UPI001CDC9442|nr:hypothetical protein [Arthrobacter sp. M4]MCA4134775.1 hypothetical protein [Arthrobacter sp. M4]